jgi:hypothetical protein
VVKVSSSPEGGDVFIDGEYQGKTPLEKTVPPREYIVTVESDTKVESKKIILEENETEEVVFNFKEKDYRLFVVLAVVIGAFLVFWGYRRTHTTHE